MLALLFLVTFVYTHSNAQSRLIQGTIVDSSDDVPLPTSLIILLTAKDSFIVADTRANESGGFKLSIPADTVNYFLLITYPNYVALTRDIYLKDSAEKLIDFGPISMIKKSKLLEEVVIKSKLPSIKIKGDTTEYTADRFKVQPNATVEELLKQLPGIQIDQFGNITAQGERVRKVLVDGEEFFGDDPTLVTRNLRADMIDKVQVYDKKSDAAAFTGIDDGVKDKTINLKIKEGKNNGFFGKIDAEAGTSKHYNVQSMLNWFREKKRMSAYATTGNTGRTGLGAADKHKLGADDEGGGSYSGKGLPKAVSTGFHYDGKWNDDKEYLNSNYKFNFTNVEGVDNTVSQNNLPTGIILSNADNSFRNSSYSHNANTKFTHHFDSTSTIYVYADLTAYTSTAINNGTIQNKRGDSSLLYNNESSANSDYDMKSYNLNVSWEKKLNRTGRTISYYLNNNFSKDNGSGESNSFSKFYDHNNMPDSTAQLQLKRQTSDNQRSLRFNVNYTEPLSSRMSLILTYVLNNDEGYANKQSYNFPSGSATNILDSSFSTKMYSTIWAHQGGAALNYAAKKTILKIGNNMTLNRVDIREDYAKISLMRNFTNWNPSASLIFKPNNYNALNINYSGSSTSPESTQLIPYSYNNTQLVTYIPNVSLKNAFRNLLSTNYQIVKAAAQEYITLKGAYGMIHSPITQSITVNSNGAYTYQFVNMPGRSNTNYSLLAAYSKKVKLLDLQAGGGLELNGGTAYSPINNVINNLNYKTYSTTLELFKNKIRQYSIYLISTGAYTVNKSSLQPEATNNYFSFSIQPSADIFVVKKIRLHTDADYLWQQKTQAFANNFDRVVWNVRVERSFLKKDQLSIKISCNDILNQNNGYARTATNTFFSENQYTTIRRYFSIGATWNFTKFKKLK
ncbi:MAG: outer membrane beta-barrel protein [Candidatus Kuenenia stuttgartiensis]|nr:outer membrane beta-barrel protein [Candidatus Kuenenia stuttgartiensis]